MLGWFEQLQGLLPDVELSIEPNTMGALTLEMVVARAGGKIVERQIRPEQLSRMGNTAFAKTMFCRIYNGLFDSNFYEYEADEVIKAAQFACSKEGRKRGSGAMRQLNAAVAAYALWSPWSCFDRGHCDKLMFRQNGLGETQDVLIRHTPWTGGPETAEDFDKLVAIAESMAITDEEIETDWWMYE